MLKEEESIGRTGKIFGYAVFLSNLGMPESKQIKSATLDYNK
jgi:hypothetical protein